jgi:hypothetical protein
MSESKEPDWPGELAKGGEGLRRQVEPIVQAAEQFVRDARRVKDRGGPALPFPQRVALAVDAGMRELLPARRQPVAHQATASLTVTPVLKATAEVAAAAGIAPSPTVYVYDGDVITFSESASVEVRDSRNDMAGRILALVLVWLIVLVIPVRHGTRTYPRRSRRWWMLTTESSRMRPSRSRSTSSVCATSGRG